MQQINDPVTEALKEKFFKLAASEEIPNTPKITQQLDALQTEIRKRNNQQETETCPT